MLDLCRGGGQGPLQRRRLGGNQGCLGVGEGDDTSKETQLLRGASALDSTLCPAKMHHTEVCLYKAVRTSSE